MLGRWRFPIRAPDAGRGSLTRRAAMGGIAACAAWPAQSVASAPVQNAKNMHEIVAGHVLALAKGRDIRLRMLIPSGSGGNVQPVARRFEQLTGVRVGITETLYADINTDLSLAALSGTQEYDLALPATFGLPDLVASGAIRPLTDMAGRYEPPGFRDGILFGVGDRFDGDIYGFQTDGDTYLMFYNKDMLEDPDARRRYRAQFGQPLEMARTWGELDRQMAFFHRPEQGQYGGLLLRRPGYLAWEWWVRFHAKGVWPFSVGMEPQIACSAGVQALHEMRAASDSQWPGADHLGLFEHWDRFAQGDVFCCLGWGGSQKFFNRQGSAMRGRLTYGPTPGGMIDGALLRTPYFNWGWNYVVTQNTAVPEIAYLYALFAATPEMSTLAVRRVDGFFDPFRPEHYEDPGIRAAYGDDFLRVHRASLEDAIPDIYLMHQGEYFRVLGEWLDRAMTAEVTPEHALERVAQRWRVITRRAGQAEQQARWQQLRAKYPAHIRRVLRDLV